MIGSYSFHSPIIDDEVQYVLPEVKLDKELFISNELGDEERLCSRYIEYVLSRFCFISTDIIG